MSQPQRADIIMEGGARLRGLPNPVDADHAVNKAYADANASGISEVEALQRAFLRC